MFVRSVRLEADPLKSGYSRTLRAEFFVIGADFPPRAGLHPRGDSENPRISTCPRPVRTLLVLITSLRATP